MPGLHDRSVPWRRFLHPYYTVNTLVVLVYPVLRVLLFMSKGRGLTSPASVRNASAQLWGYEMQTLLVLVLSLVVRLYRATTMDAFIADAFLFCKAGVSWLIWLMDKRLMVWYLLTNFAIFLVWTQPMYFGADDIEFFTPVTFFNYVEEQKNKGAGGVAWLVEVYATWAQPCVTFEPLFCELSLQYTTAGFKFGKVDVGRFPKMATKLNVSLVGYKRQLPTLILFQDGREIARLPHVYEDGTTARQRLTRSFLEKAFELQKWKDRTSRTHGPKATSTAAAAAKEPKKTR